MIRQRLGFGLFVLSALIGVCAQVPVPVVGAPLKTGAALQLEAGSVLLPFWALPLMDREPVLFVSEEGKLASGKLLFAADRILSVTSGDGSMTYVQGKDYSWDKGSRVLTVTEGSRIPSKTMAELYPAKGSKQSLGESADHKTSVFFAEGGRVFQQLQVNVTYEHAAKWSGYVPRAAGVQLPVTMVKLKAKEPVKIVVLGDSISYGACASSGFQSPPMQLPYAGLVAEGLGVEYGAPVTMVNLSLGRRRSDWGAAGAEVVADERPDLVVIGFGMNDASARIPVADYLAHEEAIVEAVRKENPKAEFVMVTTMRGNPGWEKSSPELYEGYRAGLLKMAGRGIVVADMSAMWGDLLQVKRFTDITGNGVNHPDDFGHRVYAQVILSLLQ